MSEIKLKVPGSVTKDVSVFDPKTQETIVEKHVVDFVSQGNFDAELKPNQTIAVKNRRFADFLIDEYGLTEIVEPAANDEEQPPAQDFEAEYPTDFPKRKIFIALGIPFETARNLSREQLTDVNGIADKSADEILEWQPAAPPVEQNSKENTDNGGQE